MARLLNPALAVEKNRLESDHVWTWAFLVTISGAPAPFRLVNYDQNIVFHGFTYERFPVSVDSLEDATTAALVNIRVTAANVDQAFQSLLENYWAQAADPDWRVTIFEIDAVQPDLTPFGSGQIFTVLSVTTDLIVATMDLQAEGITLTSLVPRRRYTASSGFKSIPRRN
jgi:hypothetical protein